MKRLHLNLSLTSVIIFIAAGVLLPVMLATAVGIVALSLARNAAGIVTGVLVISFAVTAAGCAIVAVVLVSRKSNLARRQADFVANVSHELRTPISAIRLHAQTLQSGKLADNKEESDRCVATILRETEWLDMMIDRVLSWRGSEKDMLPLSMEPRPVTGAINSALDRFTSMVLPDEIDLKVSIDSTRPVPHDPQAINAVMLNLLTNSYKYSGQDKKIEVAVIDADDGVSITVRDNGVGMTDYQTKRVFQPFYRAEDSDVATSGGVGLGLAIVKYLVERHGGTISVESSKGKGTTFLISLPGEEIV